jgi:hypothetical protein
MIELVEELNAKVLVKLKEKFHEVSASDLGLDPRAAHKLWANNTGIVIKLSSRRTMDYYGGFEYVASNYVHVIGDYVFYSIDDDRVAECIDSGEIEFE